MAAAVPSMQEGKIWKKDAAQGGTLGEGTPVRMQDVRELPAAGDCFYLPDGMSERHAERTLWRLNS